MAIFILSNNLYAFVQTKTEYNRSLKWNSIGYENLEISLHKYGNSTSSLSSNQLQTIFSESVSTWNAVNAIELRPIFTASSPTGAYANTIEFTNSTSYFGSGVLAVTSLNHSASTGEIYSANIYINDSINNFVSFSASKSSTNYYQAYLGDVLVHELGHLMGLGHSDVYSSTMTYSVFRGQHELHEDDINGVKFAYGTQTNSGVISGQIVGGEHIGVFGAQVQAISTTSGNVITGVLSNEDGSFEISGLDSSDSYFIYVLPPRNVSNLPSYYSSIQTKYCAGNSYKPSFFTKCGGRSKGFPQAINLARSSSIDIGEVTIRCDQNLNPEYLKSKLNEDDSYLMQLAGRYFGQNTTAVLQGYFSDSEISSGSYLETLELDLTNLELLNPSNYYLNIKILNASLGSAFKTNAVLKNDINTVYANYYYDNLGKIETELELNIPFSNQASLNRFILELTPSSLTNSEKNILFGNYSIMTNVSQTYLVLASVKKYINGTLTSVENFDAYPYEDNSTCTESDIVFSSKANVIGTNANDAGSSSTNENEPLQTASCGTIDIDNNDGQGGMMSFVLGFIIILITLSLKRKSHDFFV